MDADEVLKLAHAKGLLVGCAPDTNQFANGQTKEIPHTHPYAQEGRGMCSRIWRK